MNTPGWPGYLGLYETGELEKRARELYSRLASCRLCPRSCGANRLEGETGYCNSTAALTVASYCAHHGEEPVISGTKGSGTIFFSGCNLRCVYCQNYQISQKRSAETERQVTEEELAGIMLELKQKGCHNINLVSPSHFLAQIVTALVIACRKGLDIPLVYNTNSYDAAESLSLLEGIVDIYLPDIKYRDDGAAGRYSDAGNYSLYSSRAICEMYRQAGRLELGTDGVARKGVLVRHLILPGDASQTGLCLDWLARSLSKDISLSLMSQYHPCHRASRYPELSRGIGAEEYRRAVKKAKSLGFKKMLVQDFASPEYFLPDFYRRDPFG